MPAENERQRSACVPAPAGFCAVFPDPKSVLIHIMLNDFEVLNNRPCKKILQVFQCMNNSL